MLVLKQPTQQDPSPAELTSEWQPCKVWTSCRGLKADTVMHKLSCLACMCVAALLAICGH